MALELCSKCGAFTIRAKKIQELLLEAKRLANDADSGYAELPGFSVAEADIEDALEHIEQYTMWDYCECEEES